MANPILSRSTSIHSSFSSTTNIPYFHQSGHQIYHNSSECVNFMIRDMLCNGIYITPNNNTPDHLNTNDQVKVKSSDEIVDFCLKQLCLVDALLNARGDVKQAIINMANVMGNFLGIYITDDITIDIDNLIAIFSNKKGSWWEKDITRGAAKYVASIYMLLEKLEGLNSASLAERLQQSKLNYKQVIESIERFLNKADYKYIQYVEVNTKSTSHSNRSFNLEINLGSEGGTMGIHHKLAFYNIPLRKQTLIEERASSAKKVITDFKQEEILDLSGKLSMDNVLGNNPNLSKYTIEQAKKEDETKAKMIIYKYLKEKLERPIKISKLDLSANNLTDEDLTYIFKNCKAKIEILDLTNNTNLKILSNEIQRLNLKMLITTGTNIRLDLQKSRIAIHNNGSISFANTFTSTLRIHPYDLVTQYLKNQTFNYAYSLNNQLELSINFNDIYLSNNQLRDEELGMILFQLKEELEQKKLSIKSLYLNHNKNLSFLNVELLKIENLQYLDLSHTKISLRIENNELIKREHADYESESENYSFKGDILFEEEIFEQLLQNGVTIKCTNKIYQKTSDSKST